ncbi:unnamed protein product, partial [Ilex paraguariensis]
MEGSIEAQKAISGLSMASSASSEQEAVSKNALKKALKNKQRDEERRRKEEEIEKKAAVMQSSRVQRTLLADDEDMDPTQYFENRQKVLAAQKTAGTNPYPHKFYTSMSIPEFVKEYGVLEDGDHCEDVEVSLAGRIMNKRSSSAKLFFYDLHGDGAKVQVMADA